MITLNIDGVMISSSNARRLERELRVLQEMVGINIYENNEVLSLL
jgi:hypothetical protein